MNRRILIIEDEPGLVLTLTDSLSSEDYRAESATDGESGLQKALAGSFDLIILDVMLPRKNGMDVCREIRERKIDTPILMLTAKGETIDKVLGLKLGADDYLTKPFNVLELLARVEALMRRSSFVTESPSETYRFGSVAVDFKRAEVKKDDSPVELSATEFKLLRCLIERRGELLSRDVLLDKVWGYDATPTTRTVDVHIGQLRQKLEPDSRHPQFFITVHGFGYKFIG